MPDDEKQLRAIVFGVALGLIASRRPVVDNFGSVISAEVQREAHAIVDAAVEEAKALGALS
jgi:hypothetical protein